MNQWGRGAQSPDCQRRETCRPPASRSTSDKAFLRDRQAGCPPPGLQGWVYKYPWDRRGPLSVQRAVWLIPEQPVSCTILYWVHLSLLSIFREWRYTHSPRAAEMKHCRFVKLPGIQISSLWPPKTLPVCWTISLTYYYRCCCHCYYWMWPLYGVGF